MVCSPLRLSWVVIVSASVFGCTQADSNLSIVVNANLGSISTADPVPASISAVSSASPIALTEVDIAAGEAALEVAARQIESIDEAIRDAELKLSKATEQETSLAPQLSELDAEEETLRSAIVRAESERANAQRANSAHLASLSERKESILDTADFAESEDYKRAVEKIRNARIRRQELRREIGAKSDHQSEVQWELNQVRAARDAAKARLVSRIEHEYASLHEASERLASAVAATERKVDDIRLRLSTTEQLAVTKSAELKVCSDQCNRLPGRIADLRRERDAAIEQKVRNEKAIQIARAAIEKQKREAAELARQEEKNARQVASTPTSGASSEPTGISTSLGAHTLAAATNRPTVGTGDYYNYYNRPPVGDHRVSGYVRSNGTYVQSHRRTDADDSFWNNWSSSGNVNPYNGRIGTQLPPYQASGGSKYVNGHFRSNGTYVPGYFRRK